MTGTLAAEPRVSVVIPAYNAEQTIAGTIEALRAQAAAPAYEIIVVDNGSTDATREIVRRYDVRLLEEATRGPAAARNRGTRAARGAIVAYVDADTIPTRRWIAAIAGAFSDERVVMAAGRTIAFVPQTAVERYYEASGLFDADHAVNRPVLPFAPSLNMAVRRDVALAAQWPQEMMTAEDVVFSTRVLEAHPNGLVYADAAILYHRNRSTTSAFDKQAWTYGEGVAELYRLYPSLLEWDVRRRVLLAGRNVARAIRACFFAAMKPLRLVSETRQEFAYYQFRWSFWFWRGFFHVMRGKGRRTAW